MLLMLGSVFICSKIHIPELLQTSGFILYRYPLSNILIKCETHTLNFENSEVIGGYFGEMYRRSLGGEKVYSISIRGLHEKDLAIPDHSMGAGQDPAPTQRDGRLQLITEMVRMGWQNAAGYNTCARVEATIGGFKPVIGDRLRTRTDQRRVGQRRPTEGDVAVYALNRMLDLGRSISVRIT